MYKCDESFKITFDDYDDWCSFWILFGHTKPKKPHKLCYRVLFLSTCVRLSVRRGATIFIKLYKPTELCSTYCYYYGPVVSLCVSERKKKLTRLTSAKESSIITIPTKCYNLKVGLLGRLIIVATNVHIIFSCTHILP